jgi:hypothetical protein
MNCSVLGSELLKIDFADVVYSHSKNNMPRAIQERCVKSIFLGGFRINLIFDSFLPIDKE